MITIAESRQTFKMYHYQQVRKSLKNTLVSILGCHIQTQKENQLRVPRVILTNTLG